MRFIANRMFSVEITSIKKFEEETFLDKKILFAVSPLGRKVVRVFHIGVLIEKKETNNVVVARVVDKHGSYTVIAHATYQPEAYAALNDAEPPCRVAVVGKIKSREGFSRPFIRPEFIAFVDKTEESLWLEETTAITNKMIEELEKDAKKMAEMQAIYGKDVDALIATLKGSKKVEEVEEPKEEDYKDYTFDLNEEIIDLKDFD